MSADPPAPLAEGFAPHFRKSPVTDPWEPLYSRPIDGAVQIGLTLRSAHCNSRGLLHGGHRRARRQCAVIARANATFRVLR